MSLHQTIENVYSKVIFTIQEQLAGNIVKLTLLIKPFFLSCLGVYIAFIFYQAITQQKEGFFSEFISKIASWCFVSAVLFSGSLYADSVMPFFWEIGDHLSSLILDDNNKFKKDSITLLSNLLDSIQQILYSFKDDFRKLQWYQLGQFFMIATSYFVIYIVTSIFGIMCLAYLLMSKIFLGIVLSIAPIFICFVVFPTTRGMFNSWLSACFSFSLMSLGYTFVFQIFIYYINTNMSLNIFEDCFDVMLILIICIYVMGQVGGVMSSLTGGASFNGLNNALKSSAGNLNNIAKSTASTAYKSGTDLKNYMAKKFGSSIGDSR